MGEPDLTLLDRLRREWPMKVWLGAVLGALFLVGYGLAQRLPLREPIVLRPTALDDLIGFDPRWAWAYQSLYLLLPVAWLARSREQLWRYAAGFLIVTGIGLAAFVLVPTMVPRPVTPADAEPLYRWLVAVDLPVNCLPSLHVALAVYSVAFVSAVHPRGPRWFVGGLSAWAALIAYATLATKQHFAWDLPAGALLGFVGHCVAWSPARRPSIAATEGGPVERHAAIADR